MARRKRSRRPAPPQSAAAEGLEDRMQSDDRQNEQPQDGDIDAAEEERMIRIMQYCDGVLPAREAAAVAEEIARDPHAARLAAEMSAGADAAQIAWGSVDSGPVPLELARRVTLSARQPV